MTPPPLRRPGPRAGEGVAESRAPRDESAFDERPARPSAERTAEIAAFGDTLALGADGKVEPALRRLARRARVAARAGPSRAFGTRHGCAPSRLAGQRSGPGEDSAARATNEALAAWADHRCR